MESHYLSDILILLAAAIVAVPLFQRLGFGSVLGYLAAGVAVGPWGLGFIGQIEEIRQVAEFGVVFLLFILGIELKPERLRAMRRLVFGLGAAQLLVTAAILLSLALAFGLSLKTAVVVGFGLALSSTAFGLQILNERGEMGTTHGQTAFSVLLLQDLAVVPLLTLVLLLSAHGTLPEGLHLAVLQAVLIIVVVILVGRYFLSPILRLVASHGTSEVFTATAVFTVLGTAWLMEHAGLSLALGAFLAGLMMADSHYRHQVVADIEPFRGILLGLFFMGVGMSIDFGLLAREAIPVAGMVVGLLLVKTLVLWALCRGFGLDRTDSMRVGLLLSQSGEFGFVLFGVAAVSGLVPSDVFLVLTLLVAMTMVTTPFMANLGAWLGRRRREADRNTHDVHAEYLAEDTPHVIIAGFGRVGRRVARILMARDIPYIAVESHADRVLEARREGFEVFFGDASAAEVLKAAGASRARALVCTLNNVAPATRLVHVMRQLYPTIAIFARGRDRQHCDQLMKAGATVAVSETLESSLQIGGSVLNAMGVDEADANELIDAFRRAYYE